MSWQALAWASKQRPGRASDKLILIALADRHNEDSNIAYPSIAWLCEFSDLNRKTVIASLQRLEAAGLIADSGQRVGKSKQIKAYSLAIETVPKTEQSQKRDSPEISPRQSQKRDTEPSRNLCLSNDKQYTRDSHWPEVPNWVPADKWNAFLKMRKAMRKWPTDDAVKLMLGKLRRWRDAGHDLGAIFDNSIENNWTGLFEPKGKPANDYRNSKPTGTANAAQRAIASLGG